MSDEVTSVAGRQYAVDRLDECLKEIRSDDPNLRRMEHMIIAAMQNGFGMSRTPSVHIQEFVGDPTTEGGGDG